MNFHDKHAIIQMVGATGTSFGISLADVEATLRIISLLSGITFSAYVFIRNMKKNRVDDEKKKNT